MSEHTLSGLDLTNGKRVNLNFNFDSTKVLKDIAERSSVPGLNKVINETKKNNLKNNTEKVDTFVEKVEAQSPYTKLSEAYGGIEKLPEAFKPIKGVTSPFNLYSAISADTSKKVVDTNFKVKGLKPNEEIRIVPGTENDPKYFKIDKRAPGINTIGSTFAGMIDALTLQNTDLDRLGKEFKLTEVDYVKDNLIDLKDPKNYELSKIETDLVNQELVNRGIDTVEEDATSGVNQATDKSIEQQRKQSAFDRRERLKDSLQTTATNFATIPFYTRLLEDAAKRRLELDKAMLGAREMMPSNIQNIMLSKQSQRSLASSAFAEEAKALAAQQEAATGFAGLGMQRRFGQA